MVKPRTLTNDLSKWITKLPNEIKDTPIMHLAIPGTHDSMTYNMTYKSEVAPDAEGLLQRTKWMGRLIRRPIVKWSVTQTNDVSSQLKHGIRYFDLRLATKTGTTNLYFCHGLYCGLVVAEFVKINSFLDSHPGEIVILDFQHFYEFNHSDHTRLLEMIDNIFGNKILKSPDNLETITVKYLHKNSLQVICIYRNFAGSFVHWPGMNWPTPWPETTSVPVLFNKLNAGIGIRNMTKGYVSQCVLTPDVTFILKHLFSNLKSQCGNKVHKPVINWIKKQKPGDGKFNVSIKDFADLENWLYPKSVIDLNLKLLE